MQMNNPDADGASHRANYEVFRECISSAVVEKSEQSKDTALKSIRRRAQKARRSVKRDGLAVDNSSITAPVGRADPEELAEFVDFIAMESFSSLPEPLQSLSYSTLQHSPQLQDIYSTPLSTSTLETITSPIPLSVTDSLTVYGIIPFPSDLPQFLRAPLTEYIDSVASPPPVWITTRTNACEICERDWIPLSYHHLIPKEVHAKVLKKGWHDEWMLNSVAWLCRACHSFVHRMASNEELAREWYTVDRILERDDVQDWARWVGRVRWKAK